MLNHTQDAKRALRERVRGALQAIPPDARAAASAQACSLLKAQPLWAAAQSILFFAPLPQELDIWLLLGESIAAGKLAFLPRFVPATESYEVCRITDPATELQVGKFGIREPGGTVAKHEARHVDLLLVPGIAFDRHGRRLGRGKGYYDRLLTTLNGPRCGVALEEQIVDEIPVEPHDMHLEYILTPTRWIEVEKKSAA